MIGAKVLLVLLVLISKIYYNFRVRSTTNIVQQFGSVSEDTSVVVPNLTQESFSQDLNSQDSQIFNSTFMESTTQESSSSSFEAAGKTVTQKKKKRTNNFDDTDQIFSEAVESFKKFCKSKEEKEERRESDPIYGFGKMVTATLKTMSETKQTKAMNMVTELLMEIKLEPE